MSVTNLIYLTKKYYSYHGIDIDIREVQLILKKMSNFNRSNLQHSYNWSADGGDNAKLRGQPDSSLLDRTEGYEVLYMIQKLMDAWSLKNVESGHKIERLIKTKVPSEIHSQEKIKAWINANWN